MEELVIRQKRKTKDKQQKGSQKTKEKEYKQTKKQEKEKICLGPVGRLKRNEKVRSWATGRSSDCENADKG